MDLQHQEWIALINAYSLASNGGAAREVVEATLLKLLAYTRTHFADEEALIAERGYPDVEGHKAKHRELEAHVVKLLDDVRALKSRSAETKLNFLVTSWLLEHIKQEDRKYADFFLAA